MAVTARNARKWLFLRGLGSSGSKNLTKKRPRVGPSWDRGRSAGACAFDVVVGIVRLIISPLSVRSVSCCPSI